MNLYGGDMLVLDKIENMLQELALLEPDKLDLPSLNDLSDSVNTLTSIRQGNVDKGIMEDYADEYEFLGGVQKHILEDLAERNKQAIALVASIEKVRKLIVSDEAQMELLNAELAALVYDEGVKADFSGKYVPDALE